MREIKFRGLATNGKEWFYGNLSIITEKHKQLGQTISPGYYISNRAGVPFACDVRPETVGQYTGLKDRNGKEIYEGDVVRSYDGLSFMAVNYNEEWACFELHLTNGTIGYEISDTTDFEVIGNIHEAKPEQLKEWGIEK